MSDETYHNDDGLNTKGQQDGTGHETNVISSPSQGHSADIKLRVTH